MCDEVWYVMRCSIRHTDLKLLLRGRKGTRRWWNGDQEMGGGGGGWRRVGDQKQRLRNDSALGSANNSTGFRGATGAVALLFEGPPPCS